MRVIACVAVVSIGLAGCANPSGSTYEGVDVGRTIETTRASVVSSRVVDIAGESDLKGPVAGGIFGASAAGLAVQGSGAGIIALLAGVIGAGAGYLAQQQFNNREGIEYILDMEDGRMVTLVQNREDDEQPLADGSPVLVQVSGQYTRVIPNPRPEGAAGGGAAGDWIDPDLAPPKAGVEGEVGAGRVPPPGEVRIGSAPGAGEPVPLKAPDPEPLTQ